MNNTNSLPKMKVPYAHIITTKSPDRWEETKKEAQIYIAKNLDSVRPVFLNLIDVLYKEKVVSQELFLKEIKKIKEMLVVGRKEEVIVVTQTSIHDVQKYIASMKYVKVSSMLLSLIHNSISLKNN